MGVEPVYACAQYALVHDAVAVGAGNRTKLPRMQRCLAEAIYYEARGEGTDGQNSHRASCLPPPASPRYPGSICGVVYLGRGTRPACQFSFACYGEMLSRRSPADWQRAQTPARRQDPQRHHPSANHGRRDIIPRGQTWTGWSEALERTVQIGNHIFYKPLPRTRRSDARFPVRVWFPNIQP